MVMILSVVAAALFVLIAGLHSVLGERLLLGPLFEKMPPVRLPRRFAERTLRFAWHLTTVAWLGFAALLVLSDDPTSRAIVGGVALVTGLVAGVASKGAHFAWPVFLTIALCLALAGGLPPSFRVAAAVSVASTLALLSALHVYWAAGGRLGFDAAVPHSNGAPAFVPGPAVTLWVAAALAVAGAVALHAGWTSASASRVLMALGAAVFAVRVVGDFRSCGLFKRSTSDRFARLDTRLYVPLCFALSTGCLVLAVA